MEIRNHIDSANDDKLTDSGKNVDTHRKKKKNNNSHVNTIQNKRNKMK